MSGLDTETAPLADCNAFQIDILLVLARGGPQKGARVRDRLTHRYDGVEPGRLYPSLDQLADRALISKAKRDGRTNEYALTDRGERAVGAYAEYVTMHVHGRAAGGEW